MNRLCAFLIYSQEPQQAHFWAWCGVIIALQIGGAPARAEVRQLGIDIPVYWYADASDTLTLNAFLSLPKRALKTAPLIPSFGYSTKASLVYVLRPGGLVAGEQRWLQLGPSFVDRLTVFHRPYGSDSPWRQKEFGDHASAR